MKRMLKNYYRKALAHRRLAGARVKSPRKSQLHPINFYNLDDTFLAATILPRFANLNERIPLVNRLAIQLSRESLEYYATPTIASAMYAFAEEVERSLALQLSRFVPSCNCGYGAGCVSESFDLGTKDEPISIDGKNVMSKMHDLVLCMDELTIDRIGETILIVPQQVRNLMCAYVMRNKFDYNLPRAVPKNIRANVCEVGKFMRQSLFVDEAITGQTSAYAIRRSAVDWNFRFYSNSYYLADRDYTVLELHYGFVVMYPEHIAKMEIAEHPAQPRQANCVRR